jgi:hypothetical protein
MRRLLTLALIISLIPAAFGSLPAHAEKEMRAGHWHLDFTGTCKMTPANVHACQMLLGPATFAAMSVTGASISVHGVGVYVSDRSGHFSVRFTTWITERVPHAGPPTECDNTVVFLGQFTGACRETGTGHGHIARGVTGMPDFWEDDTAGTWSGKERARFVSTSSTDTFNPACAGTYNTQRFMKLFGIHPVPSGISARVVLIHTP